LDLTGSGCAKEIDEKANLVDSYQLPTPECMPGNMGVEERRQRWPELSWSFQAFQRTSERYK